MKNQQNEGFNLALVVDAALSALIRARRRLATAAVGLLAVWLAFHVIFGANGMVVYENKRAEFKKVQSELHEAEEENQRLTKQVDSLRNDPKAIEREAREQLHYTKKGEVIYLLPKEKNGR